MPLNRDSDQTVDAIKRLNAQCLQTMRILEEHGATDIAGNVDDFRVTLLPLLDADAGEAPAAQKSVAAAPAVRGAKKPAAAAPSPVLPPSPDATA